MAMCDININITIDSRLLDKESIIIKTHAIKMMKNREEYANCLHSSKFYKKIVCLN